MCVIIWLHIFSGDEEEVPAREALSEGAMVEGSCDEARADHLGVSG